jgi:hypothetical protein
VRNLESSLGVKALMSVRFETSRGVVVLQFRGVLVSQAALKVVLCVVACGGVCRKSAMAAEMSRSLLAKLPTLPESVGEKFDGK